MPKDFVPSIHTPGGVYTVTGAPAGIVAAALGADVDLAFLRVATTATRKAYLTEFRLKTSVATVGASAGVAGVIGLQRFTTMTPTGGTARTVQEAHPDSTGTTVVSAADLASALTVTTVAFGAEVAWNRQTLYTTGGGDEWVFRPDYPIVLSAGDGLMLRTRVAHAATQTWVYSWSAQWYER
jgi:hypothetical protein